MKIAYFITGLGLGGAEMVTIHLANQMVERGNQVLLCYLTGENAHSASINPAIEVHGLGMKKSPWGLISSLWKAKKILHNFYPDVVHSQMFHSNIFCRLLRIFVKMPVLICTEHSINIESKVRLVMYRLTDRLSDLNTNVSAEATQAFIKAKAFHPRNSMPVYNGIDISNSVEAHPVEVRRKYKIDAKEFVFLNVGRLVPAKNQKCLLEAFAMISQSAKLLIVGQGELEANLRMLITELNLNERVILAGAHANVQDYYVASDCFVLSSAWEGLPMVILEAMKYALPIITTNVGGAMETIQNQDWIVPINNPANLADAMDKMLKLSAVERKGIGLSNQQKLNKFNLDSICTQWLRLYKQPQI